MCVLCVGCVCVVCMMCVCCVCMTFLCIQEGNTPLHLATFHNNAECVKLILQSNPNCIDIANNVSAL